MTDPTNSPNSGTDTTPAGGGDDTVPGGGGGEGKSWLDGLNLPDDLRSNPTIQKFAADPEGLLRGHLHLQGHFGVPPEQIVRLPKPDDAEGMGKLWNTLGRPETPDKYGIKAPEGSDVDQAALDSFLTTLHKAGPMTKPMAQAAADWYVGYAKQQAEAADAAFKQAREQGDAALKTEWGAAYEQNLDAAAEMAERFGGKDYAAYLKKTGLGDDPATLKAWAAVAKAMGEPGAPDPGGRGQGRGKGGALTPAEAEADLAVYSDANSDAYKALYDANHAQHAYHVNRRSELFALKRGNAPARG